MITEALEKENLTPEEEHTYSLPVLTVDDFMGLSKKAKRSFLNDFLYTIDQIKLDIKSIEDDLKGVRKEIKYKEKSIRKNGEEWLLAKHDLDYYKSLSKAFPKLNDNDTTPVVVEKAQLEVFYDIYPEKLELILDYLNMDQEEFFSYPHRNIAEIKAKIEEELAEREVIFKDANSNKKPNPSYIYILGTEMEEELVVELSEYKKLLKEHKDYLKTLPKVKQEKNTNITIFTKARLWLSYLIGLSNWKIRNGYGKLKDKIKAYFANKIRRSKRNYQKQLDKKLRETYLDLYIQSENSNHQPGDYVDYDSIRKELTIENTFLKGLLNEQEHFKKKQTNEQKSLLKEEKETLAKIKSANNDIQKVEAVTNGKETVIRTHGLEKGQMLLNLKELNFLIKSVPKVTKKSLLDFRDYLDKFYYNHPTRKEAILLYLDFNYKELLDLTSTDIQKLSDDFKQQRKEIKEKFKSSPSTPQPEYIYEAGHAAISSYNEEIQEYQKELEQIALRKQEVDNKILKEIEEDKKSYTSKEEVALKYERNKEIIKLLPMTMKTREKVEKTGTFFKKWAQALLYLAPVLILLAIFSFYPIFNAFRLSVLVDYNYATGGYEKISFIHNFKAVITTGNFIKPTPGTPASALFNTFFITIVSVPFSIIVALGIAVALSAIKPLRAAFQTIFFLPYITNSLAIGLVFAYVFQDRGGLFNYFLGLFGINGGNWIGAGANYWKAMFVLIVFSVWNGLAFKIMVFLSAIQGIDQQYYQAAQIDKTSKWRQFRKITVPLISPTIFYIVITSVIGSLKTYSSIVAIFGTTGAPVGVNYNLKSVVFFIYDFFANPNNMPLASAASIILFGIILLLTFVQSQVGKRRIHY